MHSSGGSTWIIAAAALVITLWSTTGSIVRVNGAPAKLESQPAVVVNGDKAAIDSYGNPIRSLLPIETPDGRKVVSAQGLQFEIPNYASGITELKKPSDDLLPPFIDPIAIAIAEPTSDGDAVSVDVENAPLVELHTGFRQQLQQESAQAPNVVSYTGDSSLIPDYLRDLNDPDVGGPVEYRPAEDASSLKVIAWDLLPPFDREPQIITKENNAPKRVTGTVDPSTNHIKVSLSAGQPLNTAAVQLASGSSNANSNEGRVSVVALARPQTQQVSDVGTNGDRIQVSLGTRGGSGVHMLSQSIPDDSNDVTPKPQAAGQYTPNSGQRGSVYYSTTSTTSYSPTTAATTPTTTTTTTTTRRPTTTTTKRPTTIITTTTTRTTTTPAPVVITTTEDPSQFYKLANGDSYTLPTWLEGIDDPELDVAVTFVVPDDLLAYNHTVERDILPPLEPYLDLNDIQLPAPKGAVTKPTAAANNAGRHTTKTTATTPRITTSTTRRPTISTSRPHWVRANPTASTTPRPTSTRFTTFTTSTSTTTTTTTRPPFAHHHQQQHSNPHQESNAFNQDSTSTTPADRISSAEAAEAAGAATPQLSNPFLPSRYNGQYNPKPFTKASGRPATTPTTTTTTTATTTTTTTPAPVAYEGNPFDSATIPPWLRDFDYPGLGPGVPFVYDPNDPDSDVGNDLVPPSQQVEAQATEQAKPFFVTSSPASFRQSLNQPLSPAQPSTNTQHDNSVSSSPSSSDTPISSITTFPSKVTLPLPSITQGGRQPSSFSLSSSPFASSFAAAGRGQQPQTEDAQKLTTPSSSSSNNNFAAPFNSNDPIPPTADPIAADREAFPPFGGSGGAGVGTTKKTTFTKSDEGKVITNTALLQAAGAQPTAPKPFGLAANTFGNQQKDNQGGQANQLFSSPASFGISTTATNSVQPNAGGFGGGAFGKPVGTTPTAGFASSSSFSSSAAVSTSSTFSAGGSKYTGGFGGAPGILGGFPSPTALGANTPAASVPAPAFTAFGNVVDGGASVPAPAFSAFGNVGAGGGAPFGSGGAAANHHKYRGNFGGPPGVLIPYDNVQGGRP